MLRVYTTAPPADGQANKSVVSQVAKALRVPKSSVTIRKGEHSRDKVLVAETLSREELDARLAAL